MKSPFILGITLCVLTYAHDLSPSTTVSIPTLGGCPLKIYTPFVAMCMLGAGGIALMVGTAHSQTLSSGKVVPDLTLSSDKLVAALRQGGYVLVMRHTSSPREEPDNKTANPDNRKLERQLDEAGRTGATEMGKALRDLGIPISVVFTSPTYRALETVKFAQFANPTSVLELVPALGDGGQSMQGVPEAHVAWLRKQVAQAPKRGNIIIVTHMPNLASAFPAWEPVADGETLILRRNGDRIAMLVARVKIGEWPRLR